MAMNFRVQQSEEVIFSLLRVYRLQYKASIHLRIDWTSVDNILMFFTPLPQRCCPLNIAQA